MTNSHSRHSCVCQMICLDLSVVLQMGQQPSQHSTHTDYLCRPYPGSADCHIYFTHSRFFVLHLLSLCFALCGHVKLRWCASSRHRCQGRVICGGPPCFCEPFWQLWRRWDTTTRSRVALENLWVHHHTRPPDLYTTALQIFPADCFSW